MKDTSFKAGSAKRKKAAGGTKRGLTPFFVFLAEFRPQYLEKHPELKGVKEVAKAAGEKWRSMSAEEKAKYAGGDSSKKKDDKPSKKESTSSKKAKTDGGDEATKSDVEDDDEQDGDEGEDE